MVVGFDPTNMRATPRANSLPDSHHCSSARRVSVRCRARWPVFDQFAGGHAPPLTLLIGWSSRFEVAKLHRYTS